MFIFRVTANRIFIISEYWLFVPSAILANYLLVKRIRSNRASHRARMKELQKLIDQIEREKRIRTILSIALGLSVGGYVHLLPRSGSTDFIDLLKDDEIDTDYIKAVCQIEEGTRFLDNARLRRIVTEFYRRKNGMNFLTDLLRHKRKLKVIYATATALCHIANYYGQGFLDIPFVIGDFGMTSVFQTLRKAFVAIALTVPVPLYMIGSPFAFMLAFLSGTAGLRLAFSNLDMTIIATSSVDVTKEVKPRMPGVSDVVVVNNRDKIIMRDPDPVKENYECWLPDQRLLNSNCKVKPTEIPDAIDSVLPNLKYDDTINMRDVTGLKLHEFTDKLDLGKTEPSFRGKEVNFLDKFGDSGPITESEAWETFENDFLLPDKIDLRTRNKP